MVAQSCKAEPRHTGGKARVSWEEPAFTDYGGGLRKGVNAELRFVRAPSNLVFNECVLDVLMTRGAKLATTEKEQLRVNIDVDLKRKAEEVFGNYGLSLTNAVTIFFRQSVIEGGIPFEVRDSFWSAENQRALQESIAQLDAGARRSA